GKKVYFFVFTDAPNTIYEYQAEGNNWLSSVSVGSSGSTNVIPVNIVVVPVVFKPDLNVNSFTCPSTDASGKLVGINWEVMNQGKGGTITNNWADRILLSNDSIPDIYDIILGEISSNIGLKPTENYIK